jgi:hypothetical protein
LPTTIYEYQEKKTLETSLLSFTLPTSHLRWQALHLHTSVMPQLQDSALYNQIITSEETTTSDFGLDPGWKGKIGL